jgi:hypothetical protein
LSGFRSKRGLAKESTEMKILLASFLLTCTALIDAASFIGALVAISSGTNDFPGVWTTLFFVIAFCLLFLYVDAFILNVFLESDTKHFVTDEEEVLIEERKCILTEAWCPVAFQIFLSLVVAALFVVVIEPQLPKMEEAKQTSPEVYADLYSFCFYLPFYGMLKLFSGLFLYAEGIMRYKRENSTLDV